jgi:hypothetical protein
MPNTFQAYYINQPIPIVFFAFVAAYLRSLSYYQYVTYRNVQFVAARQFKEREQLVPDLLNLVYRLKRIDVPHPGLNLLPALFYNRTSQADNAMNMPLLAQSQTLENKRHSVLFRARGDSGGPRSEEGRAYQSLAQTPTAVNMRRRGSDSLLVLTRREGLQAYADAFSPSAPSHSATPPSPFRAAQPIDNLPIDTEITGYIVPAY